MGDSADRLLTVGSGKGSMRQIKIWDPRNISSEIAKLDIDSGSGTLMPFFDTSLDLLYLGGNNYLLIVNFFSKRRRINKSI